jgi:hypothetical protein
MSGALSCFPFHANRVLLLPFPFPLRLPMSPPFVDWRLALRTDNRVSDLRQVDNLSVEPCEVVPLGLDEPPLTTSSPTYQPLLLPKLLPRPWPATDT